MSAIFQCANGNIGAFIGARIILGHNIDCDLLKVTHTDCVKSMACFSFSTPQKSFKIDLFPGACTVIDHRRRHSMY